LVLTLCRDQMLCRDQRSCDQCLRHTVPGARLNRLQLLLCVTWGRSALAACLHPRPVESAAGPPGAGCAEGRTPRGGALSSAILYVAIVAIWAGVLIPRWLRRDSSSSESVGDDLTTAEPDSAADEEPARRPRRQDPAPAPRPEKRGEARREVPATRREVPEARGEVPATRREVPDSRGEVPATRRDVPEGPREVSRDESRGSGREAERKRVLSARRRLLGMLLMLVIGSGALAFTKLAAWWVVVPPSVMLLGYMALLKEAAKADAERRELARTHAADTAAAAPPAAPPAPAPPPDAEVIEIAASLGSTVPVGEEFYDQYADAKLRAVGDLARRLAS
jgi:hypothetical protein